MTESSHSNKMNVDSKMDYTSKTVKELRHIARQRGMSRYSRLRKADLIAAISRDVTPRPTFLDNWLRGRIPRSTIVADWFRGRIPRSTIVADWFRGRRPERYNESV